MSLLLWLVKKLPSQTIPVDGKPYLTRYYVFLKDRKWGNVYVHHFHMSDQKDDIHSHPWTWGLSLVLKGGYIEERLKWVQQSGFFTWGKPGTWQPKLPTLIRRDIKPGMLNLIKSTDFHRVDLHDEEAGAWTLFVTGRRPDRSSEWGFMDKATLHYRDWRTEPGAIP